MLKNRGFTLIEIVLVVVMLAAAGFAGWTWYQASTDSTGSVTSEQEENKEANKGSNEPSEKLTPTINQGLYGEVLLRTGNCMPGPGDQERKNDCKTSPVETTVYIREPTTRDDMDSQHLSSETTLVKQVSSDENGFYEAELSPGEYSVFVDDDGKEYCRRSDGQGRMCLVKIGDDITRHDIEIDHAAW